MRLDHLAYRVKDRHKTASFFIKAFGYRLAEGEGLVDGGFKISFSDGSTADCLVLEPPEKHCGASMPLDFLWTMDWVEQPPVGVLVDSLKCTTFHLAPEIFISNGTPDSIVGKWVAARQGVGGIHHLAYQVESVQKKMDEWKELGYAEFASEAPLTCPGLTQVFTKPSELTGVIFEFIERGVHGFCQKNVADLMQSTKDFS